MKQMSPSDALDMALNRLLVYSLCGRNAPGPGRVIESLPPEAREALEGLTEKDVSNLRRDDPWIWWNHHK